MNEILISVILPTYNVKNYIKQCIDSLIQQTYENLEILIVDDGSTDGTGLLCDELAAADSRIRVIHKENGGASTARNRGIQEARGQYVMFLDPDDWLDINTLEELTGYIREQAPDVIRFGYVREFPDRSTVKENTFLPETLCQGQACKTVCRQTVGLIGRELAHPENMNYLASACFCLYKKEIIDSSKLEFYDIRKIAAFSDGLFNICFLQKADRFLYVDKPYYHYRKFASGAATASHREQFMERQLLLFDMIESIAEEENRDDFREALSNRIAFSTMEVCLNALKGKQRFSQRYGEIKRVLKNPLYRKAVGQLKLGLLPMKWRAYYLLVKTHLTLPVFCMTKVIRHIQRKG